MKVTKCLRTATTLASGVFIFAGGFAALTPKWAAQAQIPGCDPQSQRLIPSLDGPTLYVTYCAVCHGQDATGHGPMASILKTPVPDLTRIAKHNGGAFPFERVADVIDGTRLSGLGHGTSEMPIWGPIFSQITSDRDYGRVRLYNLTKYLETIQK